VEIGGVWCDKNCPFLLLITTVGDGVAKTTDELAALGVAARLCKSL
jgi:hypothetical protein